MANSGNEKADETVEIPDVVEEENSNDIPEVPAEGEEVENPSRRRRSHRENREEIKKYVDLVDGHFSPISEDGEIDEIIRAPRRSPSRREHRRNGGEHRERNGGHHDSHHSDSHRSSRHSRHNNDDNRYNRKPRASKLHFNADALLAKKNYMMNRQISHGNNATEMELRNDVRDILKLNAEFKKMLRNRELLKNQLKDMQAEEVESIKKINNQLPKHMQNIVQIQNDRVFIAQDPNGQNNIFPPGVFAQPVPTNMPPPFPFGAPPDFIQMMGGPPPAFLPRSCSPSLHHNSGTPDPEMGRLQQSTGGPPSALPDFSKPPPIPLAGGSSDIIAQPDGVNSPRGPPKESSCINLTSILTNVLKAQVNTLNLSGTIPGAFSQAGPFQPQQEPGHLGTVRIRPTIVPANQGEWSQN